MAGGWLIDDDRSYQEFGAEQSGKRVATLGEHDRTATNP
jgi:hypothetical protein